MASQLFDYSVFLTYICWSSLSFAHVLHVYPMSKWLNKLNIINLNLYVSYAYTMGSNDFTQNKYR